MSITILNLSAGQLPTATTPPGVIYAGSTTKATIIKGIMLTNRGAGTEMINIYLKPGGSGPLSASSSYYLLSPKDVKLPSNAQLIIDTEITLGTGVSATIAYADQILASTSTAGTVDFVINGVQRDL